jgi:hypothetical protein
MHIDAEMLRKFEEELANAPIVPLPDDDEDL